MDTMNFRLKPPELVLWFLIIMFFIWICFGCEAKSIPINAVSSDNISNDYSLPKGIGTFEYGNCTFLYDSERNSDHNVAWCIHYPGCTNENHYIVVTKELLEFIEEDDSSLQK